MTSKNSSIESSTEPGATKKSSTSFIAYMAILALPFVLYETFAANSDERVQEFLKDRGFENVVVMDRATICGKQFPLKSYFTASKNGVAVEGLACHNRWMKTEHIDVKPKAKI